jgi:two-component system, chemotaxis family, chemotaxis protein CheY
MSLKILVVDDEPDVLKLIKTVIQSLGYEVLGLTDSREAADRITHQKFDGIFLDARMPHLDGLGLVRHIRTSATNNSVPIVMLTGYDDVETMRTGFRAGITFFMAKPPEVRHVGNILKLMQDVMLREKRSYVRLPLRTVVTCHSGGHQFTSASLNISEGGMLLEASGGLEVGRGVELRFSVPSSPGILNPRATVIWREPPDHMAVQFVDLNFEERKAIQGYIAIRVKM